MIHFLKGTLVEKHPTRLIIEVNNIGYDVHVTVNCSEQIGAVGEQVSILTYLHVREDILQLFGFISDKERQLFLQLISTPGIGPKKALAILSGSSVDDLQKYIVEENLTALTSLSGVGKKTAQRLIVDLKEKLTATYDMEHILPIEVRKERSNLVEEALLALVSLGYNQNAAHRAIHSLLSETSEKITLEELIKKTLKKL